MDALRIERLEARYHLPDSARASRERLDRILTSALPEALERALDDAGIVSHEEICIRSIHAPIRVRLSAPDEAIAAAWSAALTCALRDVLEGKPSPDIVRYGSRAHALVDLAAGVARGDLRRAWAWRQLGIWRASEGAGVTASVEELVRALVAEPTWIVSVLEELARGDVFDRIAPLFGAGRWIALATAALTAASAPGALALEGPEGHEGSEPTSGAIPAAEANRILRVSRIARAVARLSTSRVFDPALRPIAVLATLEVEPTALCAGRDGGDRLVAAVMRALRAASHGSGAPRREEREQGNAAMASLHDQRTRSGHEHDQRARSGHEHDQRARSGHEHDQRARSGHEHEAAPRAGAPLRTPATGERGAGASPIVEDLTRVDGSLPDSTRSAGPDFIHEGGADRDQAERPLPDVRSHGATRAGGLLFLVHLVGELGLPGAILADEMLGHRPLRWVLHRLAITLLPLEESDPAALAFAGLRPDMDPPSAESDPPTAEELAAIHAMADRLLDRLHERLGADDEPAAGRSLRVCWRCAEIVADPGWFEVRLSLDDVSTRIRRAGLDVDPGHIPWLGVVMRFYYE